MPGIDAGRIKEIFVEALEYSGAERLTFLDRACGDDAPLRAQVEEYLSAETQAGDFLAQPSENKLAVNLLASPLREKPGTLIGRYKLLELIGEGGFGSVFMAEQQTPVRRMVALKIIKLGMDTRQVIARFEAERQALAILDHPNIAKVLDAGETASGRPFFVMELVKGLAITEYCDQTKLSTEGRLGLFVAICHALQHAHQKGIIHRDLKPGNVLVTLHDGQPVPKLIDFGIAKATQSRLTEKTLFTEFRQFIGTPAYMSPEQAEMSGLDVDTRSDIYSLGVLLYELLTGTTPFDPKELRSAAQIEVQRIIREVDPQKPSTRLNTLRKTLPDVAANRGVDPRKLSLLLRGDLDWIVMKAMEKDRRRRYESAGEMARDIQRHLDNQPVEACPPSRLYRVRKFVSRHRTAVPVVAVSVIVMFVATLLYIRGIRAEQQKTQRAWQDAQAQRTEAEHAAARAWSAEAQANRQLVASAVSRARAGRASLLQGRRFDALSELAAMAKISPSVDVRSQAAGCLALADLQVQNEWSGPGDGICFNHDCTVFADRDPQSRDVLISQVPPPGTETAPLIARLPGRIYGFRAAFSRDDRLVAFATEDKHVHVFALDGQLLFETAGGPAFDFTPDGKSLIVGKHDGPMVVYDLHSGEARQTLKFDAGDFLSISPNGQKIATWDDLPTPHRNIEVCDLAAGKMTTLPKLDGVLKVIWHPDGKRLAIGNVDFKIYQWDVSQDGDPRPLPTMMGHAGAVGEMVFNHGGDLLASMSSDHSLRLWDVSSGQQVLRVAGGGTCLGFSADDRLLAMGGYIKSRHQVWAIAPGRERRAFIPPTGFNWHEIAFSPDGQIMACAGREVVRFWNLGDPAPYVDPVDLPVSNDDDWVRELAFCRDGTGVIARADSGLWRISLRQRLIPSTIAGGPMVRQVEIEPGLTRILDLQARGDGRMQFTTDGHGIALAQYGQLPRIVNLDHPEQSMILKSASIATMWISISPDQKWVATGKWSSPGGAYVSVWDAQTGQKVKDLPIPFEANVAFSPDGKWLATCSIFEYRFWEVGTWNPILTRSRRVDSISIIPFTGDSCVFAVSPGTWGVQLNDARSGNEMVTLDDLDQEMPIKFSPDGGELVTCSVDGTIRLWDLRRIRQELAERGLDWSTSPLPPRTALPRVDLTIGNRDWWNPAPVYNSLKKILAP